jgi:hypothetical protein
MALDVKRALMLLTQNMQRTEHTSTTTLPQSQNTELAIAFLTFLMFRRHLYKTEKNDPFVRLIQG